ncbi:Rossmann-fold NAD(P)-binding domain-containing protein [Agrobacterium vitis]|uniref:short-chain dehydrogenase n=1 Tax=Agrobacterium vitis TaxID=373 RepID=UPI0015D86F86|nr:short-chain dehydrogenase [Agrobacterium vitis]
MSRYLIVGGSGMLAQLSGDLARSGNDITVLSRNAAAVEKLSSNSGKERLYHLQVDYRNETDLRTALEAVRPFDRCVCWIHMENAPNAPFIISEFVRQEFLHVLGSSSFDPSTPDIIADLQERFTLTRPDVRYRIAVLGFTDSKIGGTRWLTHGEISRGVNSALLAKEDLVIVGRVSPWSQRP